MAFKSVLAVAVGLCIIATTVPATTAAPTTAQDTTTQEIGCGKGNFTCNSLAQCIPFANVCDGEINCEDSSDENRCTEPQYRMIVEIGQTFLSYGCFDVIQGCATQYVTPLINAGLQGPQPSSEALCKAFNQVLHCAIYESCPLSEKDRARIAPKLLELFKATMASQSCTLVVNLPNNIPTSPSQPQNSTPSPKPTSPPSKCVSSCAGLNSGFYQSCLGCDVHVACDNGIMYDSRPCPAGLLWDDNLKRCETVSTTCGPTATTPSPRNCVTSCAKLDNGDYQSCLGCGVHVTCVNGFKYDGRPCPAGLQWDDNLKRCEAVSKTCSGI